AVAFLTSTTLRTAVRSSISKAHTTGNYPVRRSSFRSHNRWKRWSTVSTAHASHFITSTRYSIGILTLHPATSVVPNYPITAYGKYLSKRYFPIASRPRDSPYSYRHWIWRFTQRYAGLITTQLPGSIQMGR